MLNTRSRNTYLLLFISLIILSLFLLVPGQSISNLIPKKTEINIENKITTPMKIKTGSATLPEFYNDANLSTVSLGGSNVIDGQLIVDFIPGTTQQQLSEAIAPTGNILLSFSSSGGYALVKIAENGESALRAAQASLSKLPIVIRVSYNRTHSLFDTP